MSIVSCEQSAYTYLVDWYSPKAA